MGVLKAFVRRKRIDNNPTNESNFKQCLTTFDLTALGIGSTLGIGLYVIAGQVASGSSGPSVVISFFIAAVASVFAGLCYAEFGARVPKAGSAYIYSYVTVGEFMAFVIGWNLILEYVIGTASVARGYSTYIDVILNHAIKNHTKDYFPINIIGVSIYPDLLSFLITLTLTLMLSIGVKESTKFNAVFTFLNLGVVIFAVIAGSFHLNWHNWNLSKEEVLNVTRSLNITDEMAGQGGFMPFGFSGMMSGAATCFYSFIGFDVIASTAEEAKNPQKSIPISICLSLLFVFLSYFSISSVQTLMLPYYLQSKQFTDDAPLPYVFKQVGWDNVEWIITIGAITGLSTSLLGAMFPLPRILFSMANDGIIPRFFAQVSPKTKVPLIATIISGLFSGILASLLEIRELTDMMAIGTLLAYSQVAMSILILRYSEDKIDFEETEMRLLNRNETGCLSGGGESNKFNNIWKQMCNCSANNLSTKHSSRISATLVFIITFLLIILASLLVLLEEYIFERHIYALGSISVICVVLFNAIIALTRQPRSRAQLPFRVPFIPYIPILSMFINFYLMLKLSYSTWIRFIIWMIIGLTIYFAYGIWNSNERKRNKKSYQQEQNTQHQTQLNSNDIIINNHA